MAFVLELRPCEVAQGPRWVKLTGVEPVVETAGVARRRTLLQWKPVDSPWKASRFSTLRRARSAINRLTPWVSWRDVEPLALMWYAAEEGL